MRLVVSSSLVRRLLTHVAGMRGCHSTPHIRCPLTSRVGNLPGHWTHTTPSETHFGKMNEGHKHAHTPLT